MKRARSLSDSSNDHSELVWTQDHKCWSDEDNPDKPLIAPIWVKSKKLKKSLSVTHKQDAITAQKNGNWEEVKKLLNHDPTLLNATDILTGKSLLMYEIQNIDHFRYLIQLRAKVNIFDKSGINVLHLAVQENVSVEILKLLIEDCNMDPNTIDARAETALFHSLMNPKRIVVLENIKYLLSKGANVNFQNRHGYSPLLMACFGFADNHELVKLFLDAGADVLATETKFHRTALMLAIECPYYWTNSTIDRDPIMTTVQHLVQAGADIFAVDKYTNTSFNFLINHYMDLELDPNSSYQNYINLLGKRIVIMALFDYLLESASPKLEQNCIPVHIMTHIQNTLLARFNAIHHTDLSCFAYILLYMPNKLATKKETQPLVPPPLNPCTLDWERYVVSPLIQKCGHHFSYHKTMTCVYIDTIGLFMFKYAHNIDKLEKWLDKLLDDGYTMHHPNQEVVSPMTALISSAMISQNCIDKFKKVNGMYRNKEPKIMSVFRIMLQNNVDISQKIILNHLAHSHLRKYCTDAYMTDALWMITLWGHTDCISLLLPYWPLHPLELLLFLLRWSQFRSQTACADCDLVRQNQHYNKKLEMLMEMGGPLSPPYNKKSTFYTIGLSMRKLRHEKKSFYKKYMIMHKSPPSLEQLCRTKIRRLVGGNVGTGMAFTKALTSLIPTGAAPPNILELRQWK